MQDAEQVVVVGGGATGLSAAAALSHRGVDALVLERDERIGATWARRYDRLHLHTIRRFSGLAHYAIPRSYPRYLSKDDYARYLAEYAQRFRLRVSLGEDVIALRPAATAAPRWEIETSRRTLRADAVIIATGHYAEPNLPAWEGLEDFRGRLLHSAEYRTGREFIGQRTLVVGLGNSGAEIAADLVEQGAKWVAVAVRTPPPIVTREMFGVLPVQLFGIALMPLGIPRVLDRVGARLRRLSVGDLRPFGICEAAWGPFEARRPAVIDVGFLDLLKARRVIVRPALSRLTEHGAEYIDGTRDEVDVVVAATGFTTNLQHLLSEVPGSVGEGGQPLTRSRQPTVAPGLYAIGFEETIRGHLFEAKHASKRLARRVAESLRPDAAETSSA